MLTRAPRHSLAVPAVRARCPYQPPAYRVRTCLWRRAACPGLTRTVRSWHGAWACHTSSRVGARGSAACGPGIPARRTLTPQEAHDGRLHPEGLTHARRGCSRRDTPSFRCEPTGRRTAHKWGGQRTGAGPSVLASACGLTETRRAGGPYAGLTARGLCCEPSHRLAGSSAGCAWAGIGAGAGRVAQEEAQEEAREEQLLSWCSWLLGSRDHACPPSQP